MAPDRLTQLRGLDPSLSRSLLRQSLRIHQTPEEFSSTLRGKAVLQFFAESSTRTRLSFETAVRKLGGLNVSFSPASSSLQKGETWVDTVNVIRQYGVDGVVMRHRSAGSPDWIANATGLPVINAGDGSHEHPTQALLDAYTLGSAWGCDFNHDRPFKGRAVLILGDTLHSRVARSNLHLLCALGAEVHLSGPAPLTIRNLELFPAVRVHAFPETILGQVDAVMTLRIQQERQGQGQIPSLREYRSFWGLTADRAARLKPGAKVLHPGPMNRGVEIDSEVADGEHSLILRQVENGVVVRMAVLARLLGRTEA